MDVYIDTDTLKKYSDEVIELSNEMKDLRTKLEDILDKLGTSWKSIELRKFKQVYEQNYLPLLQEYTIILSAYGESFQKIISTYQELDNIYSSKVID